jgi:hypothetical protein
MKPSKRKEENENLEMQDSGRESSEIARGIFYNQEDKEWTALRPKKDRVEVNGRISYQESTHSWSQLNLRKAILDEFPQLKERMSSFGYKLIFYQAYDQLEKFLKRLKEIGEPLPILVWFAKEKKSLNN